MSDMGESIKGIESIFNNLKTCSLMELDPLKTVFVIMDMVMGFTSIGALSSERVNALVPVITDLSARCGELGIRKIAFVDRHTQNSPEFDSYPKHCIKDSEEIEIVAPIKAIGGYELIYKNSTNGFHEHEFRDWLSKNNEIDNFIVVGNCTDICVQQFTISLKTWFNMNNRRVRIIVPMNAVDTYDAKPHDANLTHIMSLYNMHLNGIEIIEKILI